MSLQGDNVEVTFGKDSIELESDYSFSGRGMELSDIQVYDGVLTTVDDKTGIVFKIINNKMIPWQILADGNGQSNKGFKGEWMTVKGQGSLDAKHMVCFSA